MLDVSYEKGLHLPEIGLWLDPHHSVPFAFVSHAHSDHTGAHTRILCTEATARLTAARTGLAASRFETLAFGRPQPFEGGWSATLLPAGHVLGSAQILIESPGGSLLYTGDFKLRHGLSCEPAVAVHAETLIMETTYGRPHYRFPPTADVLRDVRKFCFETLEDGGVPVLLGYSLGKAQEILAALLEGGFTPMLHGTISKLVRIYAEFGIRFPAFAEWDPKRAGGHVLICPPSAAGARTLRGVRGARLASLTGWALDPGARFRMGVDAAFPLSDHADYPDLLAHVGAVRPQRVLTLHGFASDFARDLRARGIEAWALTGPNQLEFDGLPTGSIADAPERPPPAMPGGSFDRFAQLCEAIRDSTGRLTKIEKLAEFLHGLDAVDLEFAALWLTGRAFAAPDPRRPSVGPVILRKALSAASGLREDEVRTIGRSLNDTGLTATAVLLRRAGEPTATPIERVAMLLDGLSRASKPAARIASLAELLRTTHPVTGGFLVRILTGDLRIGLKEGLVEEAIAKMADLPASTVREANMLAGHPGRVAVLARERRLEEIGFSRFHPVACMLAGTEPDADAVWNRLGGNSDGVWLEPKLDGIRIQIHSDGHCARLFTREMKDVTASFPEIATAAAKSPACVLDGELLAWEEGRPLPFFELQKRLGRRGGDLFFASPVPVVAVLFDLLALGDRLLLREPLRERRSQLAGLPIESPLQLGRTLIANSPADIDSAFAHARADGHEGLVAKDPASPYSPGRRGLAWIKLKKAFATLDVVVTTAEFGHGRRNRVLSDLTFAVRHGRGFLDIGKAYTGLTDDEIEALTARFLAIATERRGNRITVTPEVVLEVAFDTIHPSERHPSGLALRFPRIRRIRPDKLPHQIDTLATARKLADSADIKNSD